MELTLTQIQQQWAQNSKALKDSSLPAHIRANIQRHQTKLKPQLQAAHAAFTAQPAPIVKAAPVSIGTCDFDFYMIPKSARAQMVINTVFDQWWATRKFQRDSTTANRRQIYYQLVEGIVCNFLYAHALNAEGVSVSRSRDEFQVNSHYKPSAYTAKRFLPLLDELEEMQLLTQDIGDKWKRDYRKVFGVNVKYVTQHLKPTVLKETRALVDLYVRFGQAPVAKGEVGFQREQQEVILQRKDEFSSLVEYEETPAAEKLRRQMRVVNEMLANAGPLVAPEYADTIDDRQRFLQRRFTYSSFESGGRLWNGFWQPMPKVDRPHMIRIQGEKTVELDYSNMIMRFAYWLAEEVAPAGDLYQIPGLSQASRPGIKKVMGALFFDTKPRAKFPKEVKELFAPEDQAKGFAGVKALIDLQHQGIVHLFGTGVGHALQFRESQLLVNLLIRVKHNGEVALPIHDAILVKESAATSMKVLMEWTALRMLGRVVPVEMKQAA